MKAVVVYESMFGNTREVAAHIAAGLHEKGAEVRLLPVGAATAEDAQHADLLVVGGPTHVHSMTKPSTRHAAAERAGTEGLPLEPDADGPGLREWFQTLPALAGTVAAAFDTRQAGPKLVTGRAGRAIQHHLSAHKIPRVAPAESFLVDKRPELLPGEAQRAQAWGRDLAERVALAGPMALPHGLPAGDR
jgi:hypothetical protein